MAAHLCKEKESICYVHAPKIPNVVIVQGMIHREAFVVKAFPTICI